MIGESPFPTMIGKDFLASFILFLVALPMCLGVAIASGVPPELGLITGIIGGLVVGAIGGCPLQASGPAAGLVVLVFDIVRENGLAALGVVLMMAGLLQVAAGLLKAGHWFRAISPAVVYGMLAGIGVLIMASQFHVALDGTPNASGMLNLLMIPKMTLDIVTGASGAANRSAAMIGILATVVIIGWNAFRPEAFKNLPAALLALVAASAVSDILQLEIRHVKVPANLLGSLKLPSIDLLASLTNSHYWLQAATVALIASAETLLSAAAVDRMVVASGRRDLRTNYDRELLGQGVGNFLCGLLGSIPLTGVIVRSSANVQAGAQSRWSSVMHGGWLLGTVLLVPHWLERIPTSALAAILVLTGWKLVSVEHVKKLRSYGWMPVVIYMATLVGVVAVDLLTGVLIGIGLTLAKMVYRSSQLGIHLVIDGAGRGDLQLSGTATFLRLPELADALGRVGPATELHIHFSKLSYLDHSCLELLEDWRKSHEAAGGKVVVEWDRLLERFAGRPS